MYKLCIYTDKLEDVEVRDLDVESLPPSIHSTESLDSSIYSNKLLWPQIFELNPKLLVSTMVCKYSLRRALDPYESQTEAAPRFVPSKKSQVLFLLAVPNDFSLSELASWLGPAATRIKAVKLIVLKESIGFYSVILYFDSQANCEAIYEV
eukprot:TRINITY_DN5975_c0_g1_i8.p2 TRINITY_DN5975_c0_g1~~TRINITY_DN5975_c0_g1_i8.p2  ORF type:complete len:151 (+),score=28.52 TRINITY_DN5975_c0_g1_i8:107-559(+)